VPERKEVKGPMAEYYKMPPRVEGPDNYDHYIFEEPVIVL
jgi:hypothetical protein